MLVWIMTLFIKPLGGHAPTTGHHILLHNHFRDIQLNISILSCCFHSSFHSTFHNIFFFKLLVPVGGGGGRGGLRESLQFKVVG